MTELLKEGVGLQGEAEEKHLEKIIHLEGEIANAEELLGVNINLLSSQGQQYALAIRLKEAAAKNVNVKKLEEVVQNRINASMGVYR